MSFKNVIRFVVLASCGAALVYRAALVQGASVGLAWGGALLGAVLALGLAARSVSFDTVGAVGGSLIALQFIPCDPCDGSVFMAPFVGATLGAIVGFVVQELGSVASPNVALNRTRASTRI